jgi:mannose-6-phosphate isomerase
MAVERARTRAVLKPWGVVDLAPFSIPVSEGARVGELWFERPGVADAKSNILFKLIFTSQPLSIQVHPTDAYAHSIGLPNGKSEAWYVLSAAPESKIALGLNKRVASLELRDAINDGSILDLVTWREVHSGESFDVPAGTVHAIGAGLIIAEIQQQSEATFRMYDHGRDREIHVDDAVAAADPAPALFRASQAQITPERIQVICTERFVLERIDLPPNSIWRFEIGQDAWFVCIAGGTSLHNFTLSPGEGAFIRNDGCDIRVGSDGLRALVSYTAGLALPTLLRKIELDGEPSLTHSFDDAPAMVAQDSHKTSPMQSISL